MLSQQEAEAFLYREAQLLDARLYDEWQELFAADGIYWLPLDEHADPEQEPSILYDNRERLSQRVYQLLNTPHHSQVPPSRTLHMISNVSTGGTTRPDMQVLRYNLAVFEVRPGDKRQRALASPKWLAGTCEYHLRHEERWRIVLKKVLLIDRDMPIPNLTFIL